MPTLAYSGSRTVLAGDVSTAVPNIAESAAGQINDNKTLTVEELAFTPGANGGVSVSIRVTVTGTYGELSSVEDSIASKIVEFGFESDATTAKNKLSLE